MKAAQSNPIQPDRLELQRLIFALLADRDDGLLTQGEFEVRLSDLESTLGADHQFDQRDLRGGGVRILLRCRLTGDILDLFDYRPNAFACD